eukprot:71490_1
MFLLAISVIIQFANVLCHTPLDFATVASRTCPHESDMEQRLSMMMEIIGWKSNENEFFFQQSGQSFDLWIQNIFGDEATIVFPFTIDSPAPYFTRPEFVLDMIDFSEHGSWYNLDAILNGGEQSDIPPEFFSDPSPIPFGTFLETLPFTVDISVGTSWYWCDEENAWGFGKGTVFIREKATAKTYILRAQIVTTFKKTVNFARNDEWVLNELGVMWDVYSETTPGSALNGASSDENEFAAVSEGNSKGENDRNDEVRIVHEYKISLNPKTEISLLIMFGVIVVSIFASIYYYCFGSKKVIIV